MARVRYQVVYGQKMKQFQALSKFGPEKGPVYLRLLWLGSVSTRFEKQVKSAVKRVVPRWKYTISVVEPRVVYSINEFYLPPTRMYCLLYRKAT